MRLSPYRYLVSRLSLTGVSSGYSRKEMEIKALSHMHNGLALWIQRQDTSKNWAGGDGQSVIPSSVLAEPAPRPPSTWRITPPIQVMSLRILGVGGVCWPETPG